MRRWLLVAVLLTLSAAPGAQTPQRRPTQADAVVRVLADLEAALIAGQREAFVALSSPDLPAATVQWFDELVARGPAESVVVHERSRRASGDGYDLLVEALISHGRVGNISTWRLSVQPSASTPDQFEVTGLDELSSIDDLLKLRLDRTRQFAVNDLRLAGPDVVLTMRSGSAFVAESEHGVTALVLRGDGELVFTPPDPAEQRQLEIFAGDPTFRASVDQAYIRMNAQDFSQRLDDTSLVPTTVDERERDRAQDIFDDRSKETFNLDLSDLTPELWSIEPAFGNLLFEFRSGRHGWLTYVRTPTDPEDVVLFDRRTFRNISVYASDASRLGGDRFFTEDDKANFDILGYGLDLVFDPERSQISGRGSLRVRLKPPGTSTLRLRLDANLEVSSITARGFGELLALRVSGQNNLMITLPTFVQGGAEIVLEVIYGGVLSPQELDREAITVGRQRQDPVPELMMRPERRFMYSNRSLWYPQGPVTDYATATMRLTVPSKYQVVASGSPVGSSVETVTTADGSERSLRTVEYVANRPARYLACVISRFVPVSRGEAAVPGVAPPSTPTSPETDQPAAASVDIEIVATPKMAGANRRIMNDVKAMLEFYATTVGEAPYPNFTLAALDDLAPGGHSPAFFAVLHQPLSDVPPSWRRDPVWFDPYPKMFLAHEVAHQWWGQAVGWKNYHEQWLSEGLAHYFAVLFAEFERDEGLSRRLLSEMRQSAERFSSAGPIYLGYRLGHIQRDAVIFRGLIYNKSAVVLHMLRGLIGDEAFFKGLQRFYQESRFAKAGTDDLRAAMEAGTSIDLGRFFDRWIFGATLPEVRVQSSVEAGRLSAVVRAEQAGEIFDLPLFLRIDYADGDSEMLAVPMTEAVLEHRIERDRAIRRVVLLDELVPGDIDG